MFVHHYLQLLLTTIILAFFLSLFVCRLSLFSDCVSFTSIIHSSVSKLPSCHSKLKCGLYFCSILPVNFQYLYLRLLVFNPLVLCLQSAPFLLNFFMLLSVAAHDLTSVWNGSLVGNIPQLPYVKYLVFSFLCTCVVLPSNLLCKFYFVR